MTHRAECSSGDRGSVQFLQSHQPPLVDAVRVQELESWSPRQHAGRVGAFPEAVVAIASVTLTPETCRTRTRASIRRRRCEGKDVQEGRIARWRNAPPRGSKGGREGGAGGSAGITAGEQVPGSREPHRGVAEPRHPGGVQGGFG